ILGDSTETALVNYVLEKGNDKSTMENDLPLVGKLPFDSERMRMSTLHEYGDQWMLLTKGAPVKVTEVLSESYNSQKEEWLNVNREWAADGLRILFFAYKILDEKPQEISESLETGLDFL